MRLAVLVVHALVGWSCCAAFMGIGLTLTSVTTALAIHALVVPLIFGFVSFNYFKKFGYSSPLWTAVVFLVVVAVMDLTVVSLLMVGNFEMLGSIMGTWLPFSLILASTWGVGVWVTRSQYRF
jgi:hypothetical protein